MEVEVARTARIRHISQRTQRMRYLTVPPAFDQAGRGSPLAVHLPRTLIIFSYCEKKKKIIHSFQLELEFLGHSLALREILHAMRANLHHLHRLKLLDAIVSAVLLLCSRILSDFFNNGRNILTQFSTFSLVTTNQILLHEMLQPSSHVE